MRVKKAPLQIMEVGSLISSIKNIVEIRQWLDNSPELMSLLDTMITEKTNVSNEVIYQSARRVYSGSISHRLPCDAIRRGGLHNSVLTFNSHWNIVSDTVTDFAKSGNDYNICFQAVFLHGLAIISNRYSYHDYSDLDNTMSISLNCSDCIWLLKEDKFSLPQTNYKGLALNNKIECITMIEDQTVSHSLEVSYLSGVDSYSFSIGRQLCHYWRDTQRKEKIFAVERRALEDKINAPFINLSEFTRVNVIMMLK